VEFIELIEEKKKDLAAALNFKILLNSVEYSSDLVI